MFIIRFIIIIFELILCYILQSSVWNSLTLNNAVPDLLMIVVVSVAYIRGSNAAIFYGFCAGMILDLTYGTHLGYFALIYLLCGFLSGLFHRFYRKDDNITPLLLISVCVLISQSIHYLIEFMLRGRCDYSFYLNNLIMPKLVYTVFVAAILYKLLQLSIIWSVSIKERRVREYD